MVIIEKSLKSLNSLWSKAQNSLPTNIFNFTIRYLNNTLANKKNLYMWKLATTPDCPFCLQSESLLHVVAGCKSYLEQGRYTWRHNTVLKFLAQTLPSLQPSKLFVDLPGYLSPSILTGESLRPDMLLSIEDKCLYIIELTVGFETNLERNAERKEIKYRPLLKQFENKHRKTKFINLSTSSLGMFGQASESFFNMCKELGIEQSHLNYIAIKMTTIIIRTTYYIFCMRNKPWTDPELLSY